jgi:hypothetical protein
LNERESDFTDGTGYGERRLSRLGKVIGSFGNTHESQKTVVKDKL